MNQILTDAFKGIIIKNDLIDTGALYRSIKVTINTVKDSVIVNISCEDYIKYHIDSYDLTNQFTSTPQFQNEVGNELLESIEMAIMDIIEGKITTVKEPNVLVTYNNH